MHYMPSTFLASCTSAHLIYSIMVPELIHGMQSSWKYVLEFPASCKIITHQVWLPVWASKSECKSGKRRMQQENIFSRRVVRLFLLRANTLPFSTCFCPSPGTVRVLLAVAAMGKSHHIVGCVEQTWCLTVSSSWQKVVTISQRWPWPGCCLKSCGARSVAQVRGEGRVADGLDDWRGRWSTEF